MAVLTPLSANHPYSERAFTFTDCVPPTLGARVAWQRPVVHLGHQYSMPGGRIRFRSDSPSIFFGLYFNALTGGDGVFQDVIRVLADGALAATFSSPGNGVSGRKDQVLTFGSQRMRTIELILPIACGLEFVSIDQDPKYRLMPCVPRPEEILVVSGDSITQGIGATSSIAIWSYLLAGLRKWQLINMGFSGRRTFPDDGTACGGLAPDRLVWLQPFNDYGQQVALATAKANYKAFLQNFQAAAPGALIFAVTCLWAGGTSLAIPLESYRTQFRAAVSEVGGVTSLIEGTTLATNAASSFPDNVHPNDTGNAEVGNKLAGLVW